MMMSYCVGYKKMVQIDNRVYISLHANAEINCN